LLLASRNRHTVARVSGDRKDTIDMEYSDILLESTPDRVTKLLGGIGAVATIRTLMFAAGMTDADIIEGRALLIEALAAPEGAGVPSDTEAAKEQRAATAELDEWDEPNFARYRAALKRHHPDAGAYVFRDLAASTGAAAVQGVATFLSRLDVLEQGTDPSREATREADRSAVAFLAKRGLDRAERTRLRARVDVALGPTTPLPEALAQDHQARRREVLIQLRDWFEEWSTTARAVVKKRSYLIRMGLASRRPRKPKDAAPSEPKAPAPSEPK
jgi:hypothetical protein